MLHKFNTPQPSSCRLIILNEQSICKEHYYMDYLPYSYLKLLERVDGLKYNRNIVVEVKDNLVNVRNFFSDDFKNNYKKYRILNSNKVVYISDSVKIIEPSLGLLDHITKSKYYLDNSDYLSRVQTLYTSHLSDKYMYSNLKLLYYLVDEKIIKLEVVCNTLLSRVILLEDNYTVPLVNFIDCLNIVNYGR